MSETQYYIAQGENVQGPFPESKVRDYIQRGRVRKEMMFSVNGGDWVKGSTLPQLFPAAQAPPPPAKKTAPAAPAAPAPARARVRDEPAPRGHTPRRARVADRPRRGPPSGFLTASIMDFIYAGLALAGGAWLSMMSSAAIERLRNSPEGIIESWTNPELIEQLEVFVTMGWVFVVSGCVALVMGIAIRSGTAEARTAQFIVSIGLLGLCGWAMWNQWIGVITLIGFGTQVAAIFLMMQLRPTAGKPAHGGTERPPPRRRGRRR